MDLTICPSKRFTFYNYTSKLFKKHFLILIVTL